MKESVVKDKTEMGRVEGKVKTSQNRFYLEIGCLCRVLVKLITNNCFFQNLLVVESCSRDPEKINV